MDQKQQSQKRQYLPPHPLPADADKYLADITPEEKDLIDLAMSKLASSYFMEKSHGYRQWKAKQNEELKKK